jgi:hypothetical protein
MQGTVVPASRINKRDALVPWLLVRYDGIVVRSTEWA